MSDVANRWKIQVDARNAPPFSQAAKPSTFLRADAAASASVPKATLASARRTGFPGNEQHRPKSGAHRRRTRQARRCDRVCGPELEKIQRPGRRRRLALCGFGPSRRQAPPLGPAESLLDLRTMRVPLPRRLARCNFVFRARPTGRLENGTSVGVRLSSFVIGMHMSHQYGVDV
jgi:hypothetical protein